MIVTYELIEKGKSSRGGWSNKQFRALGIKSFQKGWMGRLVGTEVTEDQAELFLRLKDIHVKNKKKRRKNCDHVFKFIAENMIECNYCSRQYPIDESSELDYI